MAASASAFTVLGRCKLWLLEYLQ